MNRKTANKLQYITSIILEILFKPSTKVKNSFLRRDAILTSQLTLFLSIGINSGIYYMWFIANNKSVSFVLLVAEFLFIGTYIISRTRRYKLASLLSVVILLIIPIFTILLSKTHTSESLIILLIWNSFTIIFSSAILDTKRTIIFSILNILMIVSFVIFIEDISISMMTIPLIFNILMPIAIIILTTHTAIVEYDRSREIMNINAALENELKLKSMVQEQLIHNATHDVLTQLPNRIILKDRISHAIEYTKRHKNRNYGILFIDIDKFKTINDTFGHKSGDSLLKEVSKRLIESVREQDLISRVGSDEFVILLEEIADKDGVLVIVNRIIDKLKQPLTIKDTNLKLSVSIGIFIGDKLLHEADDAIRNADIAMSEAKNSNKAIDYMFFEFNMLKKAKTKLEIEVNLRTAIKEDQFLLHYQPIVSSSSDKTTGFEALIRWQHPEKGLISPFEFIPIAEENGVIIDIGYWVIEEVCKQIDTWRSCKECMKDFYVSINLSNKQFINKDLVEHFKRIIDKYNIPTSYIKFELTESLIVEDLELTKKLLQEIDALGFQIMIDDFGTGYSSLSRLNTLPIHVLKIDKSFIDQLSYKDSKVVKSIINLAHSLDMTVVAEGIENIEQLTELKKLNCEFIQGYFFSKPQPPEKAYKYISN